MKKKKKQYYYFQEDKIAPLIRLVKKKFDDIDLLSFDYGQKHIIELKICKENNK